MAATDRVGHIRFACAIVVLKSKPNSVSIEGMQTFLSRYSANQSSIHPFPTEVAAL